MTRTVAEELVAALGRHGVTEVFGQSLPSAFFIAAEKNGIRQVCYRTENAGGAMADGYARTSKTLAVLGAQNGPAATLLVPPLSEAMKASVPLLALVQDVPSTHRDRNAFQELDHLELFCGCAKWVRSLNDPARVADYVDMAITAATTGRCGPAVLLLPKDILNQPAAPTRQRTARLGSFPLDRPRPDAAAVRQAADLIVSARQPLIIAGGGIHLSNAAAELATLQNTAAIPVATTLMGKGAVDETHPLSVGVVGYAMGLNSPTHHQRRMVADADVIVLMGTRTNDNGTDTWKLLPRDAAYIHIDVDGTEIGRNYQAVRCLADARAGIQDLTDALEHHPGLAFRLDARDELAQIIADGRRSYERQTASLNASDQTPIRPERVMAELDRLLTPETIVVADASYSSIWAGALLHARRAGQRFLLPRGLAGLGWGLPLALGAQTAAPLDPVVCVTGDGGFAHVWAELETAVRENLPVITILLNNSILGYQKHAELYQFGAHTRAIDLHPVDHTAIAAACGAHSIHVTDPHHLKTALTEALTTRRPTLIEITTDPDAYPPITAWDDHSERILGTPT